MRSYLLNITLFIVAVLYLASCRTPEIIQHDNFNPSSREAAAILSNMPDYRPALAELRGKGRAIVSEPGNTDRVTVLFSSNREKSLLTVKNSLGIEGGKLLTDGDSLLIYNKIDEFARKIPVRGGDLTRIDHLASLNILDMINFTVDREQVAGVWENEANYLLALKSGTEVIVGKENYTVRQVTQPQNSNLPYSRIVYDAYGTVDKFMLPRRITIFSADKRAKVAFLIQSIEINPTLDPLTITLPEDITIYYQ